MPGALSHRPSDIIQQLLADLSLGTLPEDDGSWPIFSGLEPENVGDDLIVVYDSEPMGEGRTHVDGQAQQHEAVQIVIRSDSGTQAFSKTSAIANTLDTSADARQTTVTVSGTDYSLYAVTRASGPFYLGRDRKNSKRYLYSVNYLLSVRQVA